MRKKFDLSKGTKEKILSILKEHGDKKISIFGSYARGEATNKSDLDIIVEFEAP